MKTETKILGLGFLITVLFVIGAVYFLSIKSVNQGISEGSVSQIDYSKGEKIGSDSAKVKLVEFSDLQCPACKAAEPFVKDTVSTYSGQIQFIYRQFPITIHKWSKQAANAAEAAGAQGKFWEMHNELFATQEQWSVLDDPLPFFEDLAKKLQLDEGKFKEVLDKNTYADKVQADVDDGLKLGVSGTPTFFLNGRKLSLTSFGQLKELVGQEVAKFK